MASAAVQQWSAQQWYMVGAAAVGAAAVGPVVFGAAEVCVASGVLYGAVLVPQWLLWWAVGCMVPGNA